MNAPFDVTKPEGKMAERMADYREQLESMQTELARAERAPDERRIMAAITIARDFGVAWDMANQSDAGICLMCCSNR
jgi:hypothetical protein